MPKRSRDENVALEFAELDSTDLEKAERVRDEKARERAIASAKSARSGGPRKKRSDGLFPCFEFDKKGSCKFGDKCSFSHLGKDDPGLPEGESLQKKAKKRNGICLLYQDGDCKYGDRCRYKHVDLTQEQKRKKYEDDKAIALCLQGNDPQEEKLRRIMALPERLRQKARAIFFAKQKAGGFSAKVHDDNGNGYASAEGANTAAAASTPSKVAPVKGGAGRGICFAFQRGECTRGEKCIFRHAADDDGSVQRMQEYRRSKQEAVAKAKIEKIKAKGGAAVEKKKMTDPSSSSTSFSKEQIEAMSAKPCRWFLKGNCSRGDKCFFSHAKAK